MKTPLKVALLLATVGLIITFIGKALDQMDSDPSHQRIQQELRERGDHYRTYGTMEGY
jgi:hypothetical protein